MSTKIDLNAPDPLRTVNRNATARALDLNPSNISRILSGQRVPHIVTLKRLADYLELTLDTLYDLLKIDSRMP